MDFTKIGRFTSRQEKVINLFKLSKSSIFFKKISSYFCTIFSMSGN